MTVDGLAMVRNLLDNRKLEEQQFELVLNPVELSALVKSIAKTYESLAEKKKLKLHYQIEEDIQMNTDKLYITRALDNLMSNAIKFSEPGKNIYLEMTKNGRMVEITVRDEGPGISLEDQQNLFQKYQRLSAKPTGGESSTGLGLYIVWNVAVLHKGKVFVKENDPQGAIMEMILKK